MSVAVLPGGLETTVRRIETNVAAAHAGMVQLAQTGLTRTHARARQASADKTVLQTLMTVHPILVVTLEPAMTWLMRMLAHAFWDGLECSAIRK